MGVRVIGSYRAVDTSVPYIAVELILFNYIKISKLDQISTELSLEWFRTGEPDLVPIAKDFFRTCFIRKNSQITYRYFFSMGKNLPVQNWVHTPCITESTFIFSTYV